MVVIRRMENLLANLYKNQEMRGFCHLYAGQEACGVGMKAAMKDNDAMITSYRCHGWAFLQGLSPYKIIAELIGCATGPSRGKGGSMHIYGVNFYGGNGIVGAQVPIGVGVALSMKYANTGGICMTLYGDGAANQGQTHESFNLAKVLNLPVVFVCENNKFAMGTADFRGSGSVDYYTRGSFLPGLWVDGMDVLAVREATRFAKAHIFANKGPIVMELETYRYYGHSMSDPGTSYRTRDDIQAVRNERDPITKFKDRLVTLKIATEEELNKIQKDVKKNLDDDVKKARGDPHPKLDELATDVYQKPYQKQVRGMSPFTPLDHKSIGKAIVQHLKIK
ncbi:probable pyruvate dehydrogenase E1 component subunit alpha, mitochondrial isoform X2 [Halyomorpha halys]